MSVESNNTDLVARLVTATNASLRAEISSLKEQVERLIGTNEITEYSVEVIDSAIVCEESLDVVKSLPSFSGKENSYVSWREAANNCMSLYKRGSKRYFAALTILRNKVVDEANAVLTNHGTILNFDAILSRLDFAYSDKRPIHIIEQELSVMRQGSLSIIEYYNEINKKLTLLINKTIMTYGSNVEIIKEFNGRNRQYALRIFITGLNPPLSNILFSLSPTDLPNALAKAQELEANNVRALFAKNFNRSNDSNQKPNQNNLRFPNKQKGNQLPNNFRQNSNNSDQQGNARQNFQNGNQQIAPEPMDVDTSTQFKQASKSFNKQGYYNNPNKNFEGNKRGAQSGQFSNQPYQKTQRINNLNEGAFLEERKDSLTSSERIDVQEEE